MVPADFMALSALPLLASGKVDRRALPMPTRAAEEKDVVALPRSPQEELLVEIWSELLARAPIGIRDNFFTLGGHSLLATQVIARADQTHRHCLHERRVQRAFKQAVRRAGQARDVPQLRHLAGNRLQPPDRAELLGHKDVKTTMIYTYVLNRGAKGVRSPLDTI